MADRSVMHHAPHRPVPAHRVRPVPRPDGRAGSALGPGEEDQAVSFSVEEKNIAWLTAERT